MADDSYNISPLTDPSTLTTAQLHREVMSLEKLLSQRMDAIERAVVIAHDNLVRVPTETDKSISHLKEVVERKFDIDNERFLSVQTQFRERDIRAEYMSRDSKVAIDAALDAAKEAVGKQQEASDRAIAKAEAAITKQIDQISVLISSNTKASDDKINDLKERFAERSGTGKGLQSGWVYLVAAISLVATIISIMMMIK